MFGEPRVAVDDMRLPQDRREILRRASDGGGRRIAAVVLRPEQILGLAEVDDLDVPVLQQKEVRRLQIAVT